MARLAKNLPFDLNDPSTLIDDSWDRTNDNAKRDLKINSVKSNNLLSVSRNSSYPNDNNTNNGNNKIHHNGNGFGTNSIFNTIEEVKSNENG